MKSLVIDDSMTMRRILRSYIEANDIEVVEAKDGCDALEKLEEGNDFTFALIDWDMPRMNGFEFVKAVRAKPEYNDLTLMMVTSHNSMDDIAAAIEEGSNDFLMKPFTEEMVTDKLRMLGFVN
ncbi:response regulator [Puniceicoccaceae bacterium K14]|nr:response regulator [Puniceicoccaceae bacterium K14]